MGSFQRFPSRRQCHPILYLEQHFLCVNQIGPVLGGQLGALRHYNCILGAGFDAHTTEDAPKHVDFKPLGVFLSVSPGGLAGFYGDAFGWAGGSAHITRNTFGSALFILR